MKIKLLYKSQVIAERYYEKHQLVDCKFKAQSFVVFVLILNIATLNINLAHYLPLYQDLFRMLVESSKIPSELVTLSAAVTTWSIVAFNRKKEGWEVISEQDVLVNRIYLISSFLIFIVSMLLILYDLASST
ncbi:hypothetical protein V6233_22975 [Vibrio antiquarius]